MPARAVVFDGVVAEVRYHLVYELGVARDGLLPAQDLCRDAAGGRLVHEPLRAAARGREQLHPLRRGLHRALVQAREIDDVVYERDEALGLSIYLLRQKRQVLAAGQARHHHLRVAGDGGDGRLELVRDVGREVAAHVFGDG